MNQLLPFIQGIYHWMEMDPAHVKPLASIKHICRELSLQRLSAADPTQSLYTLFYPLVISGTVETVGQGYRLSPSCIKQNQKYSAYINIPADWHPIEASLYEALPGIKLYARSGTADAVAKKHGIPLQAFQLGDYLPKIPSLRNIIDTWDDDVVIDRKGYYYFDSTYHWIAAPKSFQPGVYKKNNEVFASRVYCLAEGIWKRIPSRKENPDAFHISITYSRIQHRLDLGVRYYRKDCRLLLMKPFFPQLLERLLFLNSLLERQCSDLFSERAYHLDLHNYNMLNYLFEYTIPII